MPQIITPPVDVTSLLAGLKVNTLLSGSGTPANSVGNDGDFYIDTKGPNIYGPKKSGAWPGSYVSMVGNAVSDFRVTTPQRITQVGVQYIILPVSNPGYYAVYYNGQIVPPGLVALNGNTLTIDPSLGVAVGDFLECEYSVAATTTGGGGAGSSGGTTISFTPVDEVPGGIVNGVNKTFSLSLAPISNTLKIYLNGTTLDPSEYTLSDLNLVLVVAPASTSKLRVSYFH